MGIAQSGNHRQWTAAADKYLAERVGIVSVSALARELGRSREAVEGRAGLIGLSLKMEQGYEIPDLAAALGAHPATIARWLARGLFGVEHKGQAGRVKEAAVIRFLRSHASEYDLRRVDQCWFKAMIFGAMKGAERD